MRKTKVSDEKLETAEKETLDTDRKGDRPIIASARPIIASARPGLAGADSALLRRLPSGYGEKTVRDVLGYMVESDIKDSEAATAKSLKNELGAAGSVIVINGKNATLTDRIDKYLVDKTKDVGEREIQYQELEIEVSAVQQGGSRFYYS